MEVQINWLAVALATLSTLMVGSLWYMPKVFGDAWGKLARVDQKAAEKRGFTPILVTILVSFVTAYVLAHMAFLSNAYFANSFMQDAVTTAFWLWLGMTAARMITHDAFEGRPAKLTIINVMHELATFMVMGVVIGWLHP